MAKEEIKLKKEKKSFFKEFKTELKKVIWPTPKELANSTSAVITIVIITAIIIFALDFAFENLNKYGVNKLKTAVGNNTITTTQENDDENSINETDENILENPEYTIEPEENQVEETNSDITNNDSENQE